ncbi:MAG: M20/M25/M40 family metallo-hydrolase [Pseudomonadota bacterium]
MRPSLAALALALLAAPAAAETAAVPDLISGARQLTFEGTRAGEGYYSADATQMIFQSERAPGNPFYQMYLMDLTTGDVERVSNGIGKTTCGWIHPKGDRVLFSSTQFDPEARAKMQAELDFRASGQTRRYSWDYDPTYEIVERDLTTGQFTRLTDALGYDAEGAYSPDGSKIVFASNRAAYARALSDEDAARLKRDPAYFMDLYVMDADGANVTRLTDTPGYDGGSFWSADGSKITWRRFAANGATAEIYTMNADGSEQRQITDLGVMSWAPFFHPSGEYLIFTTNLNGFANFELYIVDTAGKRVPVRVSARDGFDGLPAFTADGTGLTWTSNATSTRKSQIFVADWDHETALASLDAAPRRAALGLPEITVADLKAHVEALASEEMQGRLTGTEGERLATQYVADAFAALGLAPAAPDGTYFEPFEFTAGVALGEGNRLEIGVAGEGETLVLDDDWRPLAFSATGELPDAPVVFAGYGLDVPASGDTPAFDSYEGLDVEGKWVLLWRGAPGDLSEERRNALSRYSSLRYKASVAKGKGALGVLFTPPPRETEFPRLPRLAFQPGAGVTSLPLVAIDRAASARMLSNLDEDLDALTQALEAGEVVVRPLEGVSVGGTVALDFERSQGRNVLARLDLDGEADNPALAIGGHVDGLGLGETAGSLAKPEERGQIHYGADDNASGVAAVLEVAQHLAAERDAGRLTGARDILFAAWSGEELGLIGARHHVEAIKTRESAEHIRESVAAYINMDMIGRLEDNLIVSGLASSPVWAREIERRNAVIGLPIETSDSPYLPTDATAFYLGGAPVLSLFTGAHGDYHTPRDTPDTLNYEGLYDITRFVALVTRSQARAEAAPEYVEVERPQPSGARQMGGVFLGTIPDYAGDGQKGVPLSGVVKGGPAELAGLQGGDVVVALAGQDLDDIYDYVRTLNTLAPGEAVEIAVERDGARVVLEIVPGLRE